MVNFITNELPTVMNIIFTTVIFVIIWLNQCFLTDAVENDFNIINSADDRLSLVFNRPLTSYEYGGVDNSDRPMYHRRNRIKVFDFDSFNYILFIAFYCIFSFMVGFYSLNI